MARFVEKIKEKLNENFFLIFVILSIPLCLLYELEGIFVDSRDLSKRKWIQRVEERYLKWKKGWYFFAVQLDFVQQEEENPIFLSKKLKCEWEICQRYSILLNELNPFLGSEKELKEW
jgi:hypothetical protein